MVNSKYLTHPVDWEERILTMESNLQNGYFDFLYFEIALNMIDARDNADYDKEYVLKKMLAAYKRNAFNTIQSLIDKLKEMI